MFINDFDFYMAEISDHEFAAYMREVDPDWTFEQRDNLTRFKAKGKTVAVVQYKNDHPVARQIWLRREGE